MRLARLLILILASGLIARAQPPTLVVDVSAQGRSLVIVVRAKSAAQLRITLPPGWSGAPVEQTIGAGVQVLSYQLDAGDAVGQGEIVVQAWSGGAYAGDRAWVWGRVPEQSRARQVHEVRLAVWRR